MSVYGNYGNYGISEAAIMGALLGSFVFTIIFYVVCSIFMMKVFQKANQEGWKAWIPIYNSWVFLELGGYKGWIALLTLAAVIPCVGFVGSIVTLVFLIMAAYQISLKMGKSSGWVALYIFLPYIWAAILGLGKDQWNDSLGKPALTAERPPTYGTAAPAYGGTAAYGSTPLAPSAQQPYQPQQYQDPAQQAYQQQQQQQQPPNQQPPQQ